ncbi:MAG: DUF1211 domain-containing protein [Taibaiella sp.]|nr:DUF1211 domain-containing protein [Taibaiella sp.]
MDNKAKFQIERIALFSDAVFAIAITLMIIEVKPPHLHHDATEREAIVELLQLTPMFVGVILSFIFIGMFWLRHHQLMKFMENYSTKLIMVNMIFLLTIVFIPFSTAFVFENVTGHSVVPMIFYNLNYILAAFMSYRLFAFVLNPANGIVVKESAERIDKYRFELLFPIGVYALVIAMSFINAQLAPIFYGAFAFEKVLNRKMSRP